MPTKFVTCPETAHLEIIDYVAHPLGMLIEACSRFQPACAVTCDRACAARLDRRARGGEVELEDEDTVVDLFLADAIPLARS